MLKDNGCPRHRSCTYQLEITSFSYKIDNPGVQESIPLLAKNLKCFTPKEGNKTDETSLTLATKKTNICTRKVQCVLGERQPPKDPFRRRACGLVIALSTRRINYCSHFLGEVPSLFIEHRVPLSVHGVGSIRVIKFPVSEEKMPRTTTVECPGCPPLRALTFDVLGLVKVVETKGTQGSIPAVVDRWGDPDASKCVLAASINDRKSNPLLAVARKCGAIEILNPLNGNLCIKISDTNDADCKPEDDPIIGLHLFRSRPELTSRSCTLLTCTTKGKVYLRSTEVINPVGDSASTSSSINTWTACASGNILCSKVDSSENYAIFGGKGVEINTWDLNESTKIWTAKSPPKNSLGIFTPTCFTSATFLCKDDHRKIVAGTNRNQVRLYDISAQRRPVISFDYHETPIKAVEEDGDGYTVYVGNGFGDLASFDMRTGKMVGSFIGKCSGSIRSIARHPDLPVIASCGLDGYLRLWDIKSRQLLSAVFLKQHLNSVVFDSEFTYQAPAEIAQNTATAQDEIEDNDGEADLPLRRKKNQTLSKSGRKKKEKMNGEVGEIEDDGEVELPRKIKKKKNASFKDDRLGQKKDNMTTYEEDGDVNEIEDHDDDQADLKRKKVSSKREDRFGRKKKVKKLKC